MGLTPEGSFCLACLKPGITSPDATLSPSQRIPGSSLATDLQIWLVPLNGGPLHFRFKLKKRQEKPRPIVLMKIIVLLLLALPLAAKPTLWIIGDSTVRNNTRGQQGWGDPLIGLFDSEKITVINKAIGGRSSRSFLTEGRWDEILPQLKREDYVLMQFGHNDGGKMFEGNRPRASIKGNNNESITGTVEMTGKEETVRSFGWYLRHYCQSAKEKGASPIVCSLIPRNIRDRTGVIQPDTGSYALWAESAAKQTHSSFIPLNRLLCRHYQTLSKDQVDAIFCGTDHTHTSPLGARFHAQVVADAIRALENSELAAFLNTPPVSLSLPDGNHSLLRSQIYQNDLKFGWLDPAARTFIANLPEGNYQVTLKFTSPEAAAKAWVKSESRRLMISPGPVSERSTRSFAVNLRTPRIADAQEVRLRRASDRFSPDWDQRLSLEFFPGTDELSSIEVKPAPAVTTIYLAGDSTVTNQPEAPYAGWGQMLSAFFTPEIAIANHAESGRALFSFRGERRLEKIFSTIRPGDYLFLQFGHNDQKDKRDGAGAFTSYKRDLESYLEEIRRMKAHPVLITPMERRRWQDGQPQQTLTDYAAAVRQVGKEHGVPVLELHAMSLKLYRALGPANSKKAFVHFPAGTFPGQARDLADDTHHSNYGAYQLARCLVQEIREKLPDLTRKLRRPDLSFDPSAPDAFHEVAIPNSPGLGKKPEGD